MAKQPATNADMRSTIFDYEWGEVGEERGGPIPGIKEKFFIMDPKTCAQGAMLLWEKEEDFQAYLKSIEYKETVLDICEGEPRKDVYTHTANLTDGVLI